MATASRAGCRRQARLRPAARLCTGRARARSDQSAAEARPGRAYSRRQRGQPVGRQRLADRKSRNGRPAEARPVALQEWDDGYEVLPLRPAIRTSSRRCSTHPARRPAQGRDAQPRQPWLGAISVAHYLALSSNDRTLAVLPLAFDYGQNQLFSAWAAGGHRSPWITSCRAMLCERSGVMTSQFSPACLRCGFSLPSRLVRRRGRQPSNPDQQRRPSAAFRSYANCARCFRKPGCT